jgi:hypothetical protein
MDLESDKRYALEESATALGVEARPYRRSVFNYAVRAGKTLLDSSIRISIAVASCLLLIKLVDMVSLRLFGHGAW